MSTKAQVNANQANAQLSTGPVTDAGKQRSSKNSTRHGLTSQHLVLTPEEKEAYQMHVQAYMDHHKPGDHKHKELVQQLADLHWSIHQVFVHQSNTMSLMAAITLEMNEAGDARATAQAIAPVTRTLNNLSIYENRRRRAATAVHAELVAYEQFLAQVRAAKAAPKQGETKETPEIGSVCSSSLSPAIQAEIDEMIRALEAEVGPEEAAKLRKDAGY